MVGGRRGRRRRRSRRRRRRKRKRKAVDIGNASLSEEGSVIIDHTVYPTQSLHFKMTTTLLESCSGC
jgi:hypothetical protein